MPQHGFKGFQCFLGVWPSMKLLFGCWVTTLILQSFVAGDINIFLLCLDLIIQKFLKGSCCKAARADTPKKYMMKERSVWTTEFIQAFHKKHKRILATQNPLEEPALPAALLHAQAPQSNPFPLICF